MFAPLIAYDAIGKVVATLDHLVAHDEDGGVVGLVDFEAHERSGAALTDVWTVSSAVGSGTWPEWLGAGAHAFTVELEPGWHRADPSRAPQRIAALVHASGVRRVRRDIDAAIAARIDAAGDQPADLRDLVGGPDRPLPLDAEGRTVRPEPRQRPSLPVAAVA